MKNETRQDRRVRRTRRLLKDSLISLMQEQEFKNISVKDITDRADLNRGTFYLHYSDIYSLLHEIEEEMLQDFQSMIDHYAQAENPDGSLLGILTPVVSYISENRLLCQIMFENNASIDFTDKFHRLIHENGHPIFQTLFPGVEPATGSRYEAFIEFATYGLIGMIRYWFHADQQQPQADLVDLANLAVLGAANNLYSHYHS